MNDSKFKRSGCISLVLHDIYGYSTVAESLTMGDQGPWVTNESFSDDFWFKEIPGSKVLAADLTKEKHIIFLCV